MKDHPWKKIQTESEIDLKLFKAHFEHLINPRNDKQVKIVRVSSRDSCNVICITEEGKIVFVHQMRFGTMSYSLEVPGGLVDKDESPIKAASRELLEETGYEAQKWTLLNTIYANAVYMDSKVFQWLAEDVRVVASQQLDEAEDIIVKCLSMEETILAMKNGTITHPHTLSALGHMFLFHPKFKSIYNALSNS